MVKITNVDENSLAHQAGILPSDYLISINGNDINDILDYNFYLAEKKIVLKIHRGEELFDVVIKKKEYSDIGLGFQTFLMDEKKSCRNKCVFCFIDQNPPGMRETIYFKDDDTRLSFLQGSYVTLTNMSDNDIDRIVKMKTSPINISVHTTNPGLREMMLKNKNAGKLMSYMKRFADAGITMNCQIVLCRSLNDGDELIRTMNDLERLYPSVASVSVVPAGLTCHRQGLYPLKPFSEEECGQVIDTVEQMAKQCRKKHGSRIFWCGDEFYLKAKRPLHGERYYEGYQQLDNGVGLITSFKREFDSALADLNRYDTEKTRNISIATGEAAYSLIASMIMTLKVFCPNINCKVYKINNRFYGENVTVAGLIVGRDLLEQLAGKDLGDTLYLPSVMLKKDDCVFLDDVTPSELEEKLKVKIRFIDNDGSEFIRAILEE